MAGAPVVPAAGFPSDRVWWGYLASSLALVMLLGAAAVVFAPVGSSVATWWPPAGVAVAMMMWTRRGLQVVTFIGIFVAIVAANVVGGRALLLSMAFGTANAVEALVVAALCGFGRTPPGLRSGGDFVRLVLASVGGAGSAGLIIGASVNGMAGGQFWVTGRAVMASHGAAILLIAPLLMAHDPRTWQVSRLEAVIQPLALAAVVASIFGPRDSLQLTALSMPFLVWGAARFGVRVAAVQVLCLGVVAWLLTSLGRGPFAAAAGGDRVPEVVSALLQAHMVASALIALPVALLTTQLAQAAWRARANAEALESVMGAATRTAIIATDHRSTVTYFNVGAEHLLGWSAAEVVGRATPTLWHDLDEIARRAEALGMPADLGVVGASVDAGPPGRPGAVSSERRDWTWLTRSGRELVVSLTVSRRYDSAGEWVGWLGVGEDVSRERAAAEALRQALDHERTAATRAAELDRARSDFVASVSHELRTPLAVIITSTDLLLDEGHEPVPADLRRDLERIERNARRLSGLVEELLGFTSVGAGSFPHQVHEVDLTDLLARVATSMQTAASDVGVDLSCEELSTPVRVHGDGAQLERALRQLVGNAVKHTAAGGSVSLAMRPGPESVAVSVHDTGTGIAQEDLPHIFDRFYRTPAAVRAALPGMGLGLAVAQSIMTAHSGAVDVDSTLGQGSTFTLIVPVEPTEPDAC